MTTYLIFTLSLFLGVSKNLLPKFSKGDFSKISNIMSANIITSVSALLIFSIQGLKFSLFLDLRFVLMAALYGLFTLGSQSLYIKAVKDGPVSICSMIYAFCFLIPTIIMAIYFKEEISIMWILGIALVIVAVILVAFKGESGQSHSKKYLIFVFGAMISAGSVGILQKFFGHIYGTEVFDEYLFLSFSFMLLYSVIGKLLTSKDKEKTACSKGFYVICIGLALSNVIANKLNLYLSAVLPATLFFPSINGLTVFLSAVSSRFAFKEKLNIMGWIGILLGITAIVMIAI